MADKRKIYLIDRKFQLRFSFGLGLFILLSSGFFSAIVWLRLEWILSVVGQGGASGYDMEAEGQKFLFLLVASQVLYALLVILAGFFFSHQIAGPIYKLKKYLSALGTAEEPPEKLFFRKGDYFPEVADEVNGAVARLKGGGGH